MGTLPLAVHETADSNFFDIVLWDKVAGDRHHTSLHWRPILVDGRLRQRRREGSAGSRHEIVELVADTLRFLGGGRKIGDDRAGLGTFWIDASAGDVELPPVLVGVTDRESDALERVELLLYAQRRHKLADAIGGLLERVRERQREVVPPAVIHQGIMPTDEPDDPDEELRPDRDRGLGELTRRSHRWAGNL